MENVWRKAPFIRIVLFFIFGILSYSLISHSGTIWVCTLGTFSVILYGMLHLKYFQQNLLPTRFASILLYVIISCSGYLVTWNQDCWQSTRYFGHYISNSDAFELQLSSSPEAKSRHTKIAAEVIQAIYKNSPIQTQGTCLLYLPLDTAFQHLKPGDHILVRNRFLPIPSPKSPGAFDYATYCHQRQLYYQAFLKEVDIKILKQHSFTLNGFFESANEATRRILSAHITDTTSCALAEALLVGYRKNIDAETTAVFSQSGLAHIIAISGMHMALIYGGMLWILGFLPKKRISRKVQIAFALILMWLFAGLTGLPASVLRAAVMLSFVALGEITQQRISSFNNIAASAFIILCLAPNQVYDIGFQLSYLAVLSLMIFHKKIVLLYFPKKKWLRALWQLTASTLAAQLLTLPVCIFYFHQVPLLFLLTNIIAIPLTSLILYMEILLLCVSKISMIGFGLGKVITWLIHSLLYIIKWINSIDFANIHDLQLSTLQLFLFYGIIFAVSIYWFYRTKWSVYLILVLWLGMSISAIQHRIGRIQQQCILAYHGTNKSYLEIIQGEHYKTIDSLPSSPNFIKYTWKPAHHYLGLPENPSKFLNHASDAYVDYFQLKRTRLLRIKSMDFRPLQPLKADYIFISTQDYIDTNTFLTSFKPSVIVFDNQVSMAKAKKLSAYFAQYHIPTHHLRQDGSLLINL